MKYIALLGLAASAAQGIVLWKFVDSGIPEKMRIDIPEEDDPFIEVPKQTDAVSDPHWGHEVERVGHQDWLDKGVEEWKTVRATIPPYTKENRVAVFDS